MTTQILKSLVLIVLLSVMGNSAWAQDVKSALLPIPNKIEVLSNEKPFKFSSKANLIYVSHPSLKFCAETLTEIFKQRTSQVLPQNFSTTTEAKKAKIALIIDETLQGQEHYTLTVSRKGITITGATAAAVFYGIQTLDQVMLGDARSTLQGQVAALTIDDAPRFGFRALMLDPARHFLPVEDVKFFIDQMARYKYNVLQLHLTDDQGWRMQIKSQPQLASQKHYTHEDLREIIAYAQERHVQIIPEIDVPGHTVAILAAYPELACKHQRQTKMEVGTTTNMMLCASQDRVYEVMADVVREVAEVFPSPYFHLGGDEAAVPKNWAECDDCKEMMKRLNFTKPTQLMIPFFDKVLNEVRNAGKKPILWCELNNMWPPADDYLFPYPKDVTLVTWRNALTPTCLDLTKKNGHPIIMAPGEHAYLDYPQYAHDFPEFNNWGMPHTTLEQTYKLDPNYGGTPENTNHIMGVMGTLWAEAIPTVNRATYMAFPRALALAESGWSNMNQRDWQSFKQRVMPNLYNLMQHGVSVRVPFEIIERK